MSKLTTLFLSVGLMVAYTHSAAAQQQQKKAPTTAPHTALDGAVLQVSLAKKGEKPMDDTITFRNGQFHSAACDEHGFGKANYTSEKVGGKTEFTSVTQGKNGETMTWRGTIDESGHVMGNAVWAKPGETPQIYEFHGTIKERGPGLRGG
ncbi:MAG: hypothetical protein AB2A00_42840 [Myxococcota bacterium]